MELKLFLFDTWDILFMDIPKLRYNRMGDLK
jgi:hypothetical protein